jgi:hypothetical protein
MVEASNALPAAGCGALLELPLLMSCSYCCPLPASLFAARGWWLQVRRPVFQWMFWDLGPGHKPDISLEKYKAVIKLLVAATAGCHGAKN